MINSIEKLFMLFLCAFFPWVVFLIDDNPGAAIISLVMQVTIIGWPFAAAWAWRSHYPPKEEKPKKNS
ncbi:MAG: hypothetical protein ACRCXC_02865 [Legionella sp.]